MKNFAFIAPLIGATISLYAEIPAGTAFTVRLIDSIDTRHHVQGQVFRATLDEPVMAGGGAWIARGTTFRVRLEEAADAGRIKGRPVLALVLTSMEYRGHNVELSTLRATTSGGSRLKRTAAVIGGGAATGAVLGGGVGALAGAGAGSVFQVVRKGRSLRIPPESRVTFTLAYPLNL